MPSANATGGLAPGSRFLIVGGGLVGAHAAVELARLGHPVTVFSRSFSTWLLEQRAIHPSIELVTGELPAGEDLSALIDAADVVLLVAGSSTPASAEDDSTASVLGSLVPTLTVLDAMRRTSTRRIVMASSGGTVYGKVQILPTPEIHVREPISLHGVNQVVSEEYALFFARQYGLEPTVLRFSNVYGPGQYVRGGQGVVAAWCRAIANGEPITLMGEGALKRDFVFARDAAQAMLAVAGTDARGSYNVGSGIATALSEVENLLRAITGEDFPVNRLPSRAVDVPVTMLDCGELERVAGWKATTSLVRGLSLTWDWYSSHVPEGLPNHGVAAETVTAPPA
ncbi:NAD-dependent epimerase/dehydratase family protein [Patulibacter minatonensis]|uniref:NAD-dependent epimerase/dehydratase family protein n=1 Tax=Patulibacter minatonensis TaxID=298163 RepID=UPI000479C567|nr:NAD-dependent epimerase/dehydratase family protein [Patulibacter minatonensis]